MANGIQIFWENPPEEGKKVLCFHEGDIYVAQRIKDKYVPLCFTTHHFAIHLSDAQKWSEIDFPDGFTGHMRFVVDGEYITFTEFRKKFPQESEELSVCMIKSIGCKKLDNELRRKEK